MVRDGIRQPDDGFGLVELVIAIFLLALISIALIPALYNGIRYSADQSTTATATRQLNALVEQARQTPTCANLTTTAGAHSFTDGANHSFTTSGAVGTCSPGTATSLTLTAKDANLRVLATANALVYIP